MRKPDIATIIGVVGGLGFILVGNALEGGHFGSLLQGTAAMIVLGGTAGAVFVNFPLDVCIRTLRSVLDVVLPSSHDGGALATTIVDFARRARKDGLVSLEAEVRQLHDPFLKRALLLALDGMDSNAMRTQLETQIGREESEAEACAKAWEAAGGFAPTMGILGAVMGLIHVMSNLSDVAKVGEGIAVAFVATIYGVGSANLLFLPMAGKIKMRLHHEVKMREMAMEGAIGIQEGMNPREVESMLESFLGQPPAGKEKK
jgi:chemotaxis protein MotA